LAERARPTSFLPPPARGMLQRKCACGTHTPGGGTCASCAGKEKRLQRKLTIGSANDPLEHEADRVAERVLAGSVPVGVNRAPPAIQRAPSVSAGEHEDVPDSVHRVIGSPGRPLDAPVRKDMEARFGHDFSGVRVHDDGDAAQSASDVGARAYTIGNNIAFGRGQFTPAAAEGRSLLAHELTHVVQQSSSGTGPNPLQLQRAPQKGKKSPAAAKAPSKPKVPQICGRDSRKVKDNWITKVNLDVGANTLTIEWDNPTKIPAGSSGSHDISPGAGKCCVDCDDVTTSQTSGSLCTPKGGSWKVSGKGCALGGHPSAKNPTYFQRGGIAIHSGNTASPPQSHGCSRTSISISQLIHDNAVIGKTVISSSGTWSGKNCYKAAASDTLVARSSVCDGFKLKPPPAPKKKPATPKPKKGQSAAIEGDLRGGRLVDASANDDLITMTPRLKVASRRSRKRWRRMEKPLQTCRRQTPNPNTRFRRSEWRR
jgi:hypothetical protein